MIFIALNHVSSLNKEEYSKVILSLLNPCNRTCKYTKMESK